MLLSLWLIPLLCALIYWLPLRDFYTLKRLSFTGLGVLAAGLLTCAVTGHYPADWSLVLLSQPTLDVTLRLHMDTLSLSMLIAVLLIGVIVLEYAARYLYSDSHQPRFMFWLTALIFSVFTLLISGNLLTAFIGWQWIGFNLYWLLNHYHYDSEANRAAKKKFVINRLGDVCFLAAVSLSLAHFGNTDFATLAGAHQTMTTWILALLLIAVLTKSAQFPFHIWLPDTLQTPTPVSAMMHAGVINAGGFLVARLSPAYTTVPTLLVAMVVIGLLTMFSASFFNASQADTKKRLAYSTMSQMGFMILQAGLGCFVGAIFHLIMHGFYKAWSFLNSGNTLYPTFARWRARTAWQWVAALLLFGSGVLLIGATQTLWTKLLWQYPLLGFFMAITLWQVTYNVVRQPEAVVVRVSALALVYLLAAGYAWMLASFQSLLSSALPVAYSSLPWSVQGSVMALVVVGLGSGYALTHHAPKAYRRLVGWSLRKGAVEPFFRRVLLQPYRLLGDRLVSRHVPALALQLWFVLLVLALLVVTKFALAWSVVKWLVLVCGLSMLLFFAAANRAARLRDRCVWLVMGQACLILITLLLPETSMARLAVFQLLNLGFSVVVLVLIFIKVHRGERKPTVITNQFPAMATYFTIAMFCLIGLPGTSTFVTELLVFQQVLQTDAWLMPVLMLGFVLLAVAILHILQDFLFNRRAVARFAIPLLGVEHAIFVLTLGYNVISGLLPLYFIF